MPKYYDPGYTQISVPLGSEEISPVRDIANAVDKSITLTALRNWVLTGYASAPPANAPLLGSTSGSAFQTITIGPNLALTGTVLGLSGQVPIANGGTGASTGAAALSALGAAPLASPSLTGTPTAPTAAPGTNTTQLATCAFTLANGGSYTLPTASASVLGGVKIGTGITITSGVISAGSGAAEGGTSSMVAVIPSAAYPASNTVDIGAKFNAAVAAVGSGGVVKIYPVPGGYACTTPMVCGGGVSVEGCGMPLINATLSAGQDVFTFAPGTFDRLGPVHVNNLILSCNGQGRDGVRVNSGINTCMENIAILDPARDGFHMEATFDTNYIECTKYTNIKISSAGRDGFHIETGSNGFTLDYINQTTFINCNSRASIGNPLKIVVNSGSPSHKVSEIEWINGELGSAGSSAPNGVWMVVTNSGSIENVHFQGVAIEDEANPHTGYAIETGGTGAATVTNCILYNFISGNIH